MTFAQIVAAVDAAFPPERRTSMTGISRWWKAERLNRQLSCDTT